MIDMSTAHIRLTLRGEEDLQESVGKGTTQSTCSTSGLRYYILIDYDSESRV